MKFHHYPSRINRDLGSEQGGEFAALAQKISRSIQKVAIRIRPDVGGFSLNARVWVAGGDRKKLERLIRYMARGPIAAERLTESFPNQLLYKMKSPWREALLCSNGQNASKIPVYFTSSESPRTGAAVTSTLHNDIL